MIAIMFVVKKQYPDGASLIITEDKRKTAFYAVGNTYA